MEAGRSRTRAPLCHLRGGGRRAAPAHAHSHAAARARARRSPAPPPARRRAHVGAHARSHTKRRPRPPPRPRGRKCARAALPSGRPLLSKCELPIERRGRPRAPMSPARSAASPAPGAAWAPSAAPPARLRPGAAVRAAPRRASSRSTGRAGTGARARGRGFRPSGLLFPGAGTAQHHAGGCRRRPPAPPGARLPTPAPAPLQHRPGPPCVPLPAAPHTRRPRTPTSPNAGLMGGRRRASFLVAGAHSAGTGSEAAEESRASWAWPGRGGEGAAGRPGVAAEFPPRAVCPSPPAGSVAGAWFSRCRGTWPQAGCPGRDP